MRSLRLICLGTALLLMLLAAGLWLYGNWPELTWRLLRWQMQFHRELGQLLRAASSWFWVRSVSVMEPTPCR